MNALAEKDAAYIAALVDGEGSISMHRHGRGHNYHASFTVTNTYLKVLTWVHDLSGLGIVEPQGAVVGNRKLSWRWRLRHEEIIEFLPCVMPYMRIKLAQAELILEFLTLEKGNGYSGVSAEIIIQRKLIFEDLQELNQKGRRV